MLHILIRSTSICFYPSQFLKVIFNWFDVLPIHTTNTEILFAKGSSWSWRSIAHTESRSLRFPHCGSPYITRLPTKILGSGELAEPWTVWAMNSLTCQRLPLCPQDSNFTLRPRNNDSKFQSHVTRFSYNSLIQTPFLASCQRLIRV